MFTKNWFFDLEKRLQDAGLDSDEKSFDEIKSNLQNPRRVSPSAFATAAIYVVLAGGFSQKTAKTIHKKIMDFLTSCHNSPLAGESTQSVGVGRINTLQSCPPPAHETVPPTPPQGGSFSNLNLTAQLLKIFNNKNKINAVVKIWENRKQYCDEYYQLSEHNEQSTLDKKLCFLSTLPHIGKITANHLARNLGENVVKYDIWIQRLGVAYATQSTDNSEQSTNLQSKIDNGNLAPEIKSACDKMFAHLEIDTNLPRGYIDVVLWKACQSGLIDNL